MLQQWLLMIQLLGNWTFSDHCTDCNIHHPEAKITWRTSFYPQLLEAPHEYPYSACIKCIINCEYDQARWPVHNQLLIWFSNGGWNACQNQCQNINISEWELCRPATIIIMVIIVMNILVIITAMIILVMVIIVKIILVSPSHTCKPSEDKSRQRSGLWRPDWSSRLSLEMRTPENKIMSGLLFSSCMLIRIGIMHTKWRNRPLGKHL